jgi:leucyl aminopeptidase (aminopeptidase T)
MAADLETLQGRSRALAELLTEADEAHFTCPRGSDFRLDLTGRSGTADDGDLTAPQAFGNLPCGEGFVAPLSGEGRLVVASLAGIGLADGVNVLSVRGGHLAEASGPQAEILLERLRAAGEQGTNLAELGVGTNEKATLTGNVLEDEKILGTVHVAFGASAGIGGTVSVPVHLDSVVLEPTLDIGGTRVIEAGRFLL